VSIGALIYVTQELGNHLEPADARRRA
jgi:hypothetical protein